MKKSILLSVFLLVSCGTGSGGSDKLTFGETVGSAWLIYQDGDYTAAYLAFGEALTNFGSMPFDSLARAHAGRGWCLARQNSYSDAIAEFSQGGANPDALAGQCFAQLANNSYQNSVTAGSSLLAANASYVFAYDPTVTSADVRLALAQAYFYLNNYPGVITQLDILSPGHGLTSASAPADILDKIMQLQGTV
ncbi:MAG: tetratricopeptide repeat protein [Bacteroidetes bacterium]|nr:tetratricopeptide repeat protein [Bacteroidota bacterium]